MTAALLAVGITALLAATAHLRWPAMTAPTPPEPQPRCPRCGGPIGDGDRVSYGVCARCHRADRRPR